MSRANRGNQPVELLFREVRHALRTLRKSPGFSAVAVATLALGIGASTAIFSVFAGVLLQPLDYGDPERIVRLQTSWAGEPDAGISPAEYFDYRDGLDVFSSVGVYAYTSPSLTGGEAPERLRAAFVSSGLLPTLSPELLLGRAFTAEEEEPGHDVVILSHDLWQRHFGSAGDVLGRTLVLNGVARTVVGVLPEGFRMPEDYTAGMATDVYLPLGIDRTTVPNRGSHFLAGVARLAAGVTVERAATGVGTLAGRMVEHHPADYPAGMRFSATALPLADDIVGAVRPALLVLLGAVGLLLVIASANVAALLLARTDARRGEFALRSALGAGRGRIVRQLIVEGTVLAVAGGAAGALLATACVELLVALQPPNLPRIGSINIDLRVLGFATAVTAVSGLLLGLAPALQATALRPAVALRDGGGRSTRGRYGLRTGLVVGQIAIALVLLVGAGLLARSFLALTSVDPGYGTEQVLTADIAVPAASYPGTPEVTGFFRSLTDRLAELPGVAAAGAVSNLPLATQLGDLNFHIEGRDTAPDEVSPAADWQTVTPGYFAAMQMVLLRGRGIEHTDDADAPGAVVISETAAERYWPGEDPIGRRFRLGGGAAPGWVTVVGIVRDVRHAGFDAAPRSQMYLPHAQFGFWDDGGPVRSLTLAIRTVGDPAAVASAVRREVSALDPALPVSTVRTMEQVVSASIARPRLMMLLVTAFAAVALVLGAVGVYGVMAYIVACRTREMGLRLALGARPPELAALVLRRTLGIAVIGIGGGLALALGVTRALTGILYGVAPTDPATFAAVPLLLGAVALVASWLPVRRAARVDPATALRHE